MQYLLSWIEYLLFALIDIKSLFLWYELYRKMLDFELRIDMNKWKISWNEFIENFWLFKASVVSALMTWDGWTSNFYNCPLVQHFFYEKENQSMGIIFPVWLTNKVNLTWTLRNPFYKKKIFFWMKPIYFYFFYRRNVYLFVLMIIKLDTFSDYWFI